MTDRRPTFSNDDIVTLKLMAREQAQTWRNTVRRPPTVTPYQGAPDVYVALTPSSGIPPLVKDTTIGTGTGSFEPGDHAGWAYCNLYEIALGGSPVGSATADNTIYGLGGSSIKVYNLSTTAIPGDTWIQVNRDKGGNWLAVFL